jgi:hypothetical protein
MRFCGRDFTAEDMAQIHALIAAHPEAPRAALSRLVCERLDWRAPDKRLKQMSCRVAMLRMHAQGLIALPAPRKGNGNRNVYGRRTPEAEPPSELTVPPADTLAHVALNLVATTQASYLWNEYIDRYHYLGYRPLPGAQLRYFARADGSIVGLLGFGAAAWKAGPRDQFIGWSAQQRMRHLHLVVNHARFLVLPWVRVPNLASRLLSLAHRSLQRDWQERYAYRPVLLETFVETPRFHGTCYKAANWTCLGLTQGRGKLDRYHRAQLPKKTIWVYPLMKNFRRVLCS